MQFDLYSQYYDLIYNSKDYSAEAKLVFDKLGLHSLKLLELGCGSGGHATIFSELGCTITGLDLSESMVELANKKVIPNFIAQQANIEQFELDDKFDAAISMFHVMSYLTENESVINCLKCVHRHLNLGGVFIFDFWFAPAVYHQGFEHRIKSFENNHIKVTRESSTILSINKNVGNVGFDILVESKEDQNHKQRIVEQHPMRFFSIPEIQNFASQTGFAVFDFFDLHSNNKPSLETWAITVKLVKV
jgi:SAM-dependent methyltransferase